MVVDMFWYTFIIIPCLSYLIFVQIHAFVALSPRIPQQGNSYWALPRQPCNHHHHPIPRYLSQSSNPNSPDKEEKVQYTTFREAEIAGLRYMQEGLYTQAVSTFQKALQLPGSKIDVIRTKLTPGPSPVGGAFLGGTEGKVVYTLDDFEHQAVYYNLACAYSQLNQADEVSPIVYPSIFIPL